jgi:hypothetical protein
MTNPDWSEPECALLSFRKEYGPSSLCRSIDPAGNGTTCCNMLQHHRAIALGARDRSRVSQKTEGL